MIDDMLQTSFLRSASLPQDAGHLFAEEEERFQEMMMMYSCAIKAVKTKLQVLNDELSMTRKRNPIEFIETRVKRPDSIATKLKKKHLPISVESVRSNLNDVAGVRVICAFLDDIYKVADMLTAQDDVELIKTKDYIKKPKMNGYRSLHLIISVPVYFSDHKEQIRVEVQIRTKDMDDVAEIGAANHLGYEKKQESERARRDAIPQGECRYFDDAYERGIRLQKLDLSKLDVNMFAAVNNSLINDGCGLYRGRLILPYEHLSRFQNDLID